MSYFKILIDFILGIDKNSLEVVQSFSLIFTRVEMIKIDISLQIAQDT
jgi:hypothetical protein